LPTHAFLATTMDIFPPQACKKLMANEDNKNYKKIKNKIK
jgi:hypothetical protein